MPIGVGRSRSLRGVREGRDLAVSREKTQRRVRYIYLAQHGASLIPRASTVAGNASCTAGAKVNRGACAARKRSCRGEDGVEFDADLSRPPPVDPDLS